MLDFNARHTESKPGPLTFIWVSHSLSVPHIPHPLNGGNKSTYSIRLSEDSVSQNIQVGDAQQILDIIILSFNPHNESSN